MYRHRSGEETPARSAMLSRRVAVVTGIAVAIFSVIFLRLWYLQVLSGDTYRELANDNRVREVRVQAPRGDIVDRDGKVLVSNRTDLALQVVPDELPKPGPERKQVMSGLSTVTGITPAEISDEIEAVRKVSPTSPVILRRGLGSGRVFYLRENQERFPGVSVERVFARDYRQGTIGAHLFGNVGEVTAEQLELPRYSNLEQGDTVGQSGIEYEYDRFLRGKPGSTRTTVDALGRPRGELRGKPARAGDNVRLTIDADLQGYGEGVLGSFGLPGAFVAMDVDDGQILAMGSTPSFDPEIFTRPISQSQYKALVSSKNDAPLANRAIQGAYPTGSVYKPITSIAALEQGVITPEQIYTDDGVFAIDVLKLRNAGDQVYGPVNMSDALKLSVDTYFYQLGLDLNVNKGRGGALQEWSSKLGIGEATGIDLPAELEGLVPTPAWRNRLYRHKLTDRRWSAGDNVNLAVGQGDVQASPLQMAVAYAAIGNGGTVVTPHLAQEVESVTGEPLQEIEPAPKRRLEIPEQARQTIMGGLRRASMEQGGTSYPVFGNFRLPVAGKTGTAERGFTESGLPLPDQAWFVALAPADDPEIVVAVTVERGGFGADSAAPVAARILEKYFGLPITPMASGGQKTLE